MPSTVVQIFPSRSAKFQLPDGIGFCPLTIANFRRRMKRFQPPPGTAEYASSWLYFTQACRGALAPYGTLIEQRDFVAGLGRHNGHWVIVRPRGHLSDDFLPILGQFVRATNARPFVFVKKADSSMRTQYADSARVNNVGVLGANTYRWDRNAPHDDDTFPEVVVSLPDLFKTLPEGGRRLRRLRSKLRRFELQKVPIELSTVRDIGRDRVMDMLGFHFESDHSNVESYVNMLKILSAPASQDTWGHFIPTIKGEPVGLFAYDRIDGLSAGVYAAVASKHYPGLGETMMLKLFEQMREEGVSFANLGGSETEGLRDYKRKFVAPDEAGSVRGRRHRILVLDFRPILKLE
jgi:hypothetical protein